MVNAQRGRRTKTFLLHSPDTQYPQHKMALGKDGRNVDNTTHEVDPNSPIKDEGQYYDTESNEDKGGRKMSRIAGVMGGDVDQNSELGVGKQLELEATNSIKYRTCSWQKVFCFLPFISQRHS